MNKDTLVKDNICLIFSAHTKYEYFSFNKIEDIPTEWLYKHVGPTIEPVEIEPICLNDNIPLRGYKYYTVCKSKKGILQYHNNEVGFRYNTGSYMFIRFSNCKNAMDYFEHFKKKYYNTVKVPIHLNRDEVRFLNGDIVRLKTTGIYNFDTALYSMILNVPVEKLYFNSFNGNKSFTKAILEVPTEDQFQVYTSFIDDDNHRLIVPCMYPDINEFRLKGVDGYPWMTACPSNMFIPEEKLEFIRSVDNVKS